VLESVEVADVTRFTLDTSALIAYLDDEGGANRVQATERAWHRSGVRIVHDLHGVAVRSLAPTR
jgi:hypothetical protein